MGINTLKWACPRMAGHLHNLPVAIVGHADGRKGNQSPYKDPGRPSHKNSAWHLPGPEWISV